MSTISDTRYIEIDSTYRDRKQWPNPAQFDVLISQSAQSANEHAVDPVSLAAPKNSWRSNRFQQDTSSNQITVQVDISSRLGSVSTAYTFIIDTVSSSTSGSGSLQPISNYYTGAVLVRSSNIASRSRILRYRYLGDDRAEIVVSPSVSLTNNGLFDIQDPTDLSSPEAPIFFIPNCVDARNAYANCLLYNETRNEYRRTTPFFPETSTLSVDTSGSNVSTKTTGPVSNWTETDAYSLRGATPLLCTSLENPTLSRTAFNLSPTTQLNNLENGFIEKTDDLTDGRDSGTLQSVASNSEMRLDVSASSVDGFYIGCRIRMSSGPASGEIATIVRYDGTTRTVTLETGFVELPNVGDQYFIVCPFEARQIVKYVNFKGQIAQSQQPSTTELVFPVSASSINNAYRNLYIRISSGLAAGEVRQITHYTVTREPNNTIHKVATVDTPFTGSVQSSDQFTITSGLVSPGFTAPIFENSVCILPFSYDNMNPFVYTGSITSQQNMVCYEIQLMHVTLPNVVLDKGTGRSIAYLPYVYVDLANVSGATSGAKNIIYSNNPHSTRMLFRAGINDISDRKEETHFVLARGDCMAQTIKFKPNDNLRFTVRLPNGELFSTLGKEQFGPKAPNAEIQISALFQIRRLCV